MGRQGRPQLRLPASSLRRLSLVTLYRAGEIAPGQRKFGFVDVVWSSCPFGGRRPFFLCPRCGARALVLFFSLRARVPLACRTCHGLVDDTSSTMDPTARAFARRDRILAQLGERPGSVFDLPRRKPPRMPWATYLRLREAAVQAELEGMVGGAAAVTGRSARAGT